MSSLLGLGETIAARALFGELYADRRSHGSQAPKAGGKADKRQPTQGTQARARLSSGHIASYSPQDRGRMERLFGTPQQRLPPALRHAGITTIAAANRWLRETFVADCDGRVGKPAAKPGRRPWRTPDRHSRMCCACRLIARSVATNCVQWGRSKLQIARQRHRHHYVRATNGSQAISDGAALPRPLRPGDIVLAARTLTEGRT
jgi:hypothetical protein